MTTAPDLPLPAAQIPAPVDPSEPFLTVVPAQPGEAEYADGTAIELDEALRRAGPRLKRYAVRRLHDEHEAEEVVQEALLRAFQHRHLLATEDDLMAWMTVVTGRLVIDRLRVRGRATPVAELPPGARTGRDTADVVVARDEARLALDALEAMPARQASVLWAREVEGLSYDEIGARFGMTEPSVRSVLHRARKTLRREYTVRGGTLPGIALVALAPWLHGLRVADRLRQVAKRGAGAAGVAATGLVVATVVPFTSPHAPAHAAPPMKPALKVHKAVSTAPAHHRTAAPAHTRAAPVQPTTVTRHPHRWADRIPAPALCGGSAAGHEVSAGCTTHEKPTLYVQLPVPVAGNHGVGVSQDSDTVCAAVPTTPLTECDTNSPTSQGTAS